MTTTGRMERVTHRTGLTSVGVGAIVMALGCLALAQALASRAVGLLGIATLLAVGLAFAVARRSLDIEGVRSDLPPRLREGQIVGVTVALRARRRAAGLVLVEELPEALGGERSLAVPLAAVGAEVEHRYVVVPTRRGRYQIGPLTVRWQDPFGMTRRSATILGPTEVIVHPRIERVADRVITRAWEDPPIRPPVSKPWPTGFEFYGLRDYAHGDDPRRIVWRATARSLDLETGEGRYLVAESEQGITDRVIVLVDVTPVDEALFETIVRTAASIAAHHLDEGASVRVDAGGRALATALRGRRATVPMLDRFAQLEPGATALSEVLMQWLVEPGIRTAHGVVVTSGLDREAARRLRLLVEGGMNVLLVLIVGDDPDPLLTHRAGAIGCGVVEIHSGRALTRSFQHVVTARRS